MSQKRKLLNDYFILLGGGSLFNWFGYSGVNMFNLFKKKEKTFKVFGADNKIIFIALASQISCVSLKDCVITISFKNAGAFVFEPEDPCEVMDTLSALMVVK